MRRAILGLGITALLLTSCSGSSTPPEDPQPDLPAPESQTSVEATPAPPPSTSQPTTPPPPATQPEPDPQSTLPLDSPVADVAPVTLASPDNQLTLPRPATLPTLRVFAPDGSETRLLAVPNTSSFAWISEPDRVVFTQRRDGTTWIVAADPATGNVEPLLPTGDRRPTLRPSPDGKRLAVIPLDHPDPATITLLDPATNTAYPIPTSAVFPGLSWAPDSSRLLLFSDGRILVYDTEANLQLELLPAERPYRTTAWAPDASFILLTNSLSLRRLDLATGLTTVLLGREELGENSLPPLIAVSPDSSQIALAWHDVGLARWRLDIVPATTDRDAIRASTPLLLAEADPQVHPRSGWIDGLSWSPAGDRLAFTRGFEPNTAGLWVLHLADGDAVRADVPPEDTGFYLAPPRWSADGALLLATRATCYDGCDGGPWGRALIDTQTGAVLWESGTTTLIDLDDGPQLAIAGLGVASIPSAIADLFREPNVTHTAAASPSGEWIVVASEQSAHVQMRYAIQPDGSAHVRLGVSPDRPVFFDRSPPSAPHPGDASIAATVSQDGAYLESPTGRTKISDFPGSGLLWAPDGSAIAYFAAYPASPQIIVAPIDGSGAYPLITGYAIILLEWRTDGAIVYVAGPFGI